MRVFHFDPYSIRPKERCTVGALRAEAADVDISYHHAPKRGNMAAMASVLRDQAKQTHSIDTAR